MPFPEAARKELTGLDIVTHFVTLYEPTVSIAITGNQSPAVFKKQTGAIYADQYYFSLFEHEWLAGSKETALKDPYQLVLTEKRAKIYFGNIPPASILGKQVIYDDSIKVTVSGIVKDMDHVVSDLEFEEFLSLETAKRTTKKDDFGPDNWGSINSDSQLFVKLGKGTSAQQINKQFIALRDKNRVKEGNEKDATVNHLQPLNDLHFNQDYDIYGRRQAHKPTMYGLLIVALFLLLLGCINFINLTTAQSALRAKEIGIRKTAGSSKRQLVLQFLSETFILTLLATILSILMVPWLLNIFHDFIPAEVSFKSLNQVHVWLFLALLLLVVTFFAGFYPALVLTRFQPVTVLKGQAFASSGKTSKAWLRKSLTVTQFIIAQFLVIATLLVNKQIYYSLNKDLGYKKDAIAFFQLPWNLGASADSRFALLEKIKSFPEIQKVSLSSAPPASGGTSSTELSVTRDTIVKESMVEMKYADSTYFDIYQMKLLAGKWLQKSDTTREFLINEAYAKELGLKNPADAVGLFAERSGKKVPIVGVLADFNTKSTHIPIKPLAFSMAKRNAMIFHLALQPRTAAGDNWKTGLSKVEKAFKEFYPGADFKYTFFDESIANFYKKEKDISRLLTWAAGLCIFISCLGLLGLVIYITNTRTKEIGVRKVLGASVAQLVTLLSKDFLSLILIAFIIALPLAWWALNNWLQDFAYRTSLSWWIFAASGAGMLLIALIILSIRTIRSAMTNPVRSLRTE